jgi:DNA repair exonuclease SbcCD ATPase subunit
MDKQQLHKRLEELHAELQQVDSVAAGERDILQKLTGDIEALLAQREGVPAHHYKSLAERLRDDIEQLEASHPQAALLMGQVVDLLAMIGI